MQVVCSGCSAKIKVPDKAAGKKIKCPRCATVLTVPMADAPAETQEPAEAPPPPEEPPEEEAPPEETPDEEPADDTEVAEKPLSRSKRASRDDDENDDEDSGPPKRRRARDDDDDDQEENEDEDDDRPRRKRRRDEDDDDDDVDIRKRRGRRGKKGPNGLAITSMILGISAVVVYFGMWVCSAVFAPFGIVACFLGLILAVVGAILGHLGKKPGSEGFALTGLICSYIVLALYLLSIIGTVVVIIVFGAAIFAFGARGPRPPMPPPRRF
jgi:hypothetical protein